MDRFYTINQVCQILGVTRTTVNRYMATGKLRYWKTGNARTCKVLISVKDVELLLATMERPATSVIELAKKTGRSRRAIYNLRDKLGRYPSEEEVLNTKLGRPKKN